MTWAIVLLATMAAGCADGGASITVDPVADAQSPETGPSATSTGAPPGTTATPTVTATETPAPSATACAEPRYQRTVEPPPLPTWTPVSLADDPELLAVIDETLGPLREHVSLVVTDLTHGRTATIAPDRVWYAASLYKLPLLFEAAWQWDQGVLNPDEVVVLTCAYTAEDLGTLAPLGLKTGSEVSVADAVRYMTVASDNALAHLLSDLLGARNVDAHLAAIGARDTTVNDAALPTTARDVALLLQAIGTDYPSPDAATAMFELLSEQWIRTRLPRGVPADAVVGNKTGDYAGVSHDAAIVRASFGTYVLVMLTDGQVDEEVFGEVSAAIYRYLASSVPNE